MSIINPQDQTIFRDPTPETISLPQEGKMGIIPTVLIRIAQFLPSDSLYQLSRTCKLLLGVDPTIPRIPLSLRASIFSAISGTPYGDPHTITHGFNGMPTDLLRQRFFLNYSSTNALSSAIHNSARTGPSLRLDLRNIPMADLRQINLAEAFWVTDLEIITDQNTTFPDNFFRNLPPHLTAVQVKGNSSDPIDLTDLPTKLISLDIRDSQFSGTPDLTHLPQTLTSLCLSWNKFSGTPDLTHLPETLTSLCLSFNQFSGTPDLTHLPQTLTHLCLSFNQFSGTPDLTHLPETLIHLSLYRNQFSGTPDLTRLPARIAYLDLSENQWSGSFDFTQPPRTNSSINLNINQFYRIANTVGRFFDRLLSHSRISMD